MLPTRQIRAANLSTVLGWSTVLVWAGLAACRSRFWCMAPRLAGGQPSGYPSVTAVIPARNEEEHLGECLEALLQQRFNGKLNIVLVDDNSIDATGAIAHALAAKDKRLRVLQGRSLSPGWSGKMWAVSQGLAAPEALQADFVLLTDADILHGATHVAALVHAAQQGRYELVSEMVRLRTETLAERSTVPAFVFFFSMLYPFLAVSNAQRSIAAAAGGTMLVSRAALDRIDGVSRIRGALIDDVALAQEIKRGDHRIWLGHADDALSLRQYPHFGDVWNMIARTAYVQLNHSPLLLAGTIMGMLLIYIAPVVLTLRARKQARWLGIASWVTMAALFQPTLRHYRRSWLWGAALPVIAAFYLGATLASALRHYRGKGGNWKGRVYPQLGASERAGSGRDL